MPTKKFSIVIGVCLFAIGFVWMNGISQTTGQHITTTYVSSSVPTPGPGQKKVLLKDLGMT